MTSDEVLQELKLSIYNKNMPISIIHRQEYLIMQLEQHLEVLEILKKHAHSSYKKTYMYEGPVIPTNEGKFMGWTLHSIDVLILNSNKDFNKVKEWLENEYTNFY